MNINEQMFEEKWDIYTLSKYLSTKQNNFKGEKITLWDRNLTGNILSKQIEHHQ